MRLKPTWGKCVFLFVLLSLVASTVYALLGAARAPAGPIPATEHGKVKSDYVLMLVECVLGIVVMFLPSMLKRQLHIAVPGRMYIVFVVFLYAAIYLGEIRSFYYRFSHWDTVLHAFSSIMLGALGFSVVSLLNDSEKVAISLSPLFVALFAFCFAVALGVVWEIYEFSIDGLLGLNMQKFAEEGGSSLVGRAALVDTMDDLIVDSAGALITSIVGFISIRRKKDWLARISIKRIGVAKKE